MTLEVACTILRVPISISAKTYSWTKACREHDEEIAG